MNISKTHEAEKNADLDRTTNALLALQEKHGTAALADLLAETVLALAEIEDAPRATKKLQLAAGILAEYARKA